MRLTHGGICCIMHQQRGLRVCLYGDGTYKMKIANAKYFAEYAKNLQYISIIVGAIFYTSYLVTIGYFPKGIKIDDIPMIIFGSMSLFFYFL